MNVEKLSPAPTGKETFKRSRDRFVPNRTGCYVLTSLSGEVLYVGLATNLRTRMNNHLDTPEKVLPTPQGRAAFFFWLETKDLNLIERTWMNIHIQEEGRLPILNSAYSPTST